jgi:16S rRNA (cytosine967-C5)-methyltransferase
VAQHLSGDPHGPPALTAAESERIETADLAAAPPNVQADLPDGVAGRFAAVFGDDWVAEGAALALRPPLDMRVNALKADRARVEKALARHGAAPTRYAPLGLRIAATSGEGRHPNVQAEAAFRKGWFEVQDEGSQLAALLTGAAPGMQVADVCAGGGGKTLALAALMQNKGQIFAHDVDGRRLAPLKERLDRAGARNVQIRAPQRTRDVLADLHGCMDMVVVDAPCTGSGTWRRSPDSKWRLRPNALGKRLEEQRAALALAAPLVKPGGRLVYVTCSVLPEENEDQVAAFAAQAGFAPAPLADLGAPGYRRGEALQMTPLRTGCDGFFVAALRRND